MKITNDKISDISGNTAEWAYFSGFSILFENPQETLQPGEAICLALKGPQQAFYAKLSKITAMLKNELNQFHCCVLSPRTFHVTVFDGINSQNIHDVTSKKDQLDHALTSLPETMKKVSAMTGFVDKSLTDVQNLDIEFKFQKLAIRDNNALVACLEPADNTSARTLVKINRLRVQLNGEMMNYFGLKTASAHYTPHISIGYFANLELGRKAHNRLAIWDGAFREAFKGEAGKRTTVKFNAMYRYYFTDMETFIHA